MPSYVQCEKIEKAQFFADFPVFLLSIMRIYYQSVVFVNFLFIDVDFGAVKDFLKADLLASFIFDCFSL